MLIHAHIASKSHKPEITTYSPPTFGTGSSTAVLPVSPPEDVSFSNASNVGNFFNEMRAVRVRLTTSFPSSKLSSPLSSSKSLFSSTASSGPVALRRIVFSRSGNCGVWRISFWICRSVKVSFGFGGGDRLIRGVGLVSKLRCVGRFRLYLRGSGGGSHGVRLQGYSKSW